MLRKSGLHTFLFVVCAVAVCTSCAVLRPAARAPVGPVVSELEYKRVEQMRSEFGYIGSGYVQMSLRSGERLAAEPVYFSKRPLYGEIRLGDSEDNRYVLVIDESKGTRSGYDTFYIDANNNEDLTDDEKIVGEVAGDRQMTEFPPVELTVEYAGQQYPYHLVPMIYSYGDIQVNWFSAAYCEGELTFGDKTYKVALFDDNCNGVFNDAYAVPRGYPRSGVVRAQGDTMVIDVNGDGEFRKHFYDTPEMYHVGKYVSFGGRCYELDVEPSGRKVTVRETELPCGYITTKQRNYSVELLGEDGALKLNGGARRVKVPAGEYRLAACSFEGEDDGGKLWRVVGQGDWSQPAIEVDPDGRTSVKFGPPLTASITAARSGDSFNLVLQIKGQGGETYSAGSFLRGGRMPPAPRFEIRNGEGEIVASADFAYG